MVTVAIALAIVIRSATAAGPVANIATLATPTRSHFPLTAIFWQPCTDLIGIGYSKWQQFCSIDVAAGSLAWSGWSLLVARRLAKSIIASDPDHDKCRSSEHKRHTAAIANKYEFCANNADGSNELSSSRCHLVASLATDLR